MLKKYLLIFLSANLLATEGNKDCFCKERELSITEMVILASIGGTVSVIAAAPLTAAVAIAGAGTAIASAASVVAPYVIPTTVIGKVGLGLTAAQLARPLILQTTEEKLSVLLREKAERPTKANTEFVSCLKANKNNPRNASGLPEACEDAALFYAFNASVSKLNKKTEAFNSGECFCG